MRLLVEMVLGIALSWALIVELAITGLTICGLVMMVRWVREILDRIDDI